MDSIIYTKYFKSVVSEECKLWFLNWPHCSIVRILLLVR